MKCPFETTSTQCLQGINEYNESGLCTSYEHTLIEKHDFIDCLQEDCACFENGKCKRTG